MSNEIDIAATRNGEFRLLPCPFCGGSDLIYAEDEAEDAPGHFYAWHVFCRDCHCHGRNNFPIGWCENKKAAVEAWNLRGYKRNADFYKALDALDLHPAEGANPIPIPQKPAGWYDAGYLMSIIDAAIDDGFDPDEDGPLLDEIRAELADKAPPQKPGMVAVNHEIDWAVEQWRREVEDRPIKNVHRRSLDDTWRQVIRHFGGDDVALIGPAHDDLLASSSIKEMPL